ncbi:MAG: hypothetical protein ABRQ37_21765 [Candidatus Eremiobacterota bacterium]
MVLYFIWEFIILYYFKINSPSVEGEIIEMRLYSLRNLFTRRNYILIIILGILPFLLFWPVSPYIVILIAGMISFIKSILFLFKKSHVSAYCLKARYVVMQIMVIILMVVTFKLAVNYIPGG